MNVVMIATIMIVIVRVAMMIEIRNVVIKIVVVVTIRAHDLIKDMTTVATKQSMMIDDKTGYDILMTFSAQLSTD